MSRVLFVVLVEALLSVSLSTSLFAAPSDVILFTENSFEYWNDTNQRVDPANAHIASIESFTDLSFGDLYLLLDNYLYDGDRFRVGIHKFTNYQFFFKANPRISLGKLLGWQSDRGLLKDFLITSFFERGTDTEFSHVEAYTFGIAADFNVPHFAYFQLNVMARNEDKGAGWAALQISPVWGSKPFQIGGETFVTDGYLHWIVNSTPDAHASIQYSQQIKWDLGQHIGFSEQTLWAGIRVRWWEDKYGIRSTKAFPTGGLEGGLLIRYDVVGP